MRSDLEMRRSVTPLPGSRTTDEVGLQALHQAASRLTDARRGAPKFRTKELVGLLLSHGARTWRNSMPVANVRLRVCAPSGKQAVRLRLGA